MNQYKNEIYSCFSLTEEEKSLVDQILCEEMNMRRCVYIINYISTLKFDNNSLFSFLLFQLYKVNPQKAESLISSVDEDCREMFESFKLIKDVNNIINSNEAEDIRRMFLVLAKDLRVVIMKLCGVLYDLKIIEIPLSKQEKVFSKNVKEIFAPLAERLGLGNMKSTMEDYCFFHEDPKAFEELSNNVVLKKEDNYKQIELTKSKIKSIMQELKIDGEIQYRQKHISSIFKKIKFRGVTLGQIYDLIAMRVVVDSVEECYAIFGKIHSIYKPMQGRVKDYIANPKPNGYRSLHTTIIVENNRPLEIQIRTKEMHKNSEYGVSAHWIYKEKRKKTNNLDKKLFWLRDIIESSKEMSDEEFINSLKTQLYEGEIYVQTPKGKVLQFPEGSTIIDFAYAIHSDVGNSCVGGKINNIMKPLVTNLKSGDIVEIITNPSSKGPSRDWLSFVRTSSARSKIRQFFKSELKEENILTGKNMLDQALTAKKILPSQVLTEKYIHKILEKYSMENLNELYASIGFPSLNVGQVVGQLITYYNRDHNVFKEKKIKTIQIKNNSDGVNVDGESGLLVKYAHCCNPVVGDEIVGYISHGQGVTIHRATCSNVKYLEEERLVDASWEDKNSNRYDAVIKGIFNEEKCNIAKIINALSDEKILIKAFESKKIDTDYQFQVVVCVKNSGELKKIIVLLENISGMRKVYRNS